MVTTREKITNAFVYDQTLELNAEIIEVIREENSIPIYILRYEDGKLRERFLSEILFYLNRRIPHG